MTGIGIIKKKKMKSQKKLLKAMYCKGNIKIMRLTLSNKKNKMTEIQARINNDKNEFDKVWSNGKTWHRFFVFNF